AQDTLSVAQILPQRLDKRLPASRADDFLRNLEISPLQTHGAKRIDATHPLLHLFFGAISKKPFSSSSSSWLTCSFRNSDRSPLDMFRSTDMTVYDVSKILAIAATCLPHSRVSLL